VHVQVGGLGPTSAKVCLVVDRPRLAAHMVGLPLNGWDRHFIEEKLKRAGLAPSEVRIISISQNTNAPTDSDFKSCLTELNSMTSLTVLIPLGEVALKFITGKRDIDKWHLSLLDPSPEFRCHKAIPTYHPDDVKKDFALGLYVEMTFRRAAEEYLSVSYDRKPHNFLLNPSIEKTFEVLARLESAPVVAVDIETGRGQINTVGFAWSPSDAIAIQVLPDRCGATQFYELWRRIARVLEGPSAKYMHNGIYETMYLSRYGIQITNFLHDTQIAQKFLWPEFSKALANVGRIYTREPYWKDTGKVESEEGGKKDWGNIRDWTAHFRYNCLDTTGTFEGAVAQRKDLSERGQLELFDSYVMRFLPPLVEMCSRGLPVCRETQARLTEKYERDVAELLTGLSVPLNPRSTKDKLKLFRDKGYKLPKVRDKKIGRMRESANELSLKKLRLLHPDDRDIQILLEVSKKQKALSAYLKAECDEDGFFRYMLDGCGTETGRWSGSKDPWDRGFNPQTLPKVAKKMIKWGD